MGSRAAIRYAKSVLELAVEQKTDDQISLDMSLLSKTFNKQTEFLDLINNPVIKSKVKVDILTSIFDSVNPLTKKLFDLLSQNKRISLLPEVATNYIQLYNKHYKKETARLTTVVPLSNDLKDQVQNKLKELTGKEATIDNVIDPSLLGGYVLRVGDVQYDASIAGKIKRLKREFTLN